MNGLPDLTAHDVVQFSARLPKMHVSYASILNGTDCGLVTAMALVDFEGQQLWDLSGVAEAARLTKSKLAGRAYRCELAEGTVSEAILERTLHIHWSAIEPRLRSRVTRYEEDVAEAQRWFDQADPNGFEWQTPDCFVPDLEQAKTRLAEAQALFESLRDGVA